MQIARGIVIGFIVLAVLGCCLLVALGASVGWLIYDRPVCEAVEIEDGGSRPADLTGVVIGVGAIDSDGQRRQFDLVSGPTRCNPADCAVFEVSNGAAARTRLLQLGWTDDELVHVFHSGIRHNGPLGEAVVAIEHLGSVPGSSWMLTTWLSRSPWRRMRRRIWEPSATTRSARR